MSRVVVTGAGGFIGSHLAEALLARGHEVVGLEGYRGPTPRAVKEHNLSGLRDREAFSLVEADLATADLEPALAGAEAVFHLAALPGLLPWDAFPAYLEANLLCTQRLLEAARRTGGPHVLHASTSSVYGREARCAEDGPLAPCSPYGVTKVAAEVLCRTYERNHGLPLTILRFFSVYGPRQRPDMAYHIFIRRLLEGSPIDIHGDGEQSRSNTFVTDCVEGAVRAWERADASIGQTFNLGGGEVVTVNEALGILQDLTGRRAEVRHTAARPGDQRHTRADFSRAEELLGYRPATALRDGLARQLAWQRERLASLPG